MRIRTFSFKFIAVGILAVCAICFYWRATRIFLADLPNVDSGTYWVDSHYVTKTYKVDPYIEAAQRLQAMGKTSGCAKLLQLSLSSDLVHTDDDDYQKVDILCRMLFVKRLNSDFRVPWIGGARFFGGTDETDWPLAPIEIIDGVPFALTTGYSVHGTPESAEAYLHYCMTNCDWSNEKFTPKTEQQEKSALSKLLASPKWRTPLTQEEKAYLSAQIKNAPPLEYWPSTNGNRTMKN